MVNVIMFFLMSLTCSRPFARGIFGKNYLRFEEHVIFCSIQQKFAKYLLHASLVLGESEEDKNISSLCFCAAYELMDAPNTK